MPDTDGVDKALEGTLRVALTAAARIGEQVARQRETDRRRAEADGVDAARDYQTRIEGEEKAARPRSPPYAGTTGGNAPAPTTSPTPTRPPAAGAPSMPTPRGSRTSSSDTQTRNDSSSPSTHSRKRRHEAGSTRPSPGPGNKIPSGWPATGWPTTGPTPASASGLWTTR